MNNLQNYKNNITSQSGEDGIIEEIFNRIGSGNQLCVEFGAWDAKYFSNTWNLWHNMGWSAILIEGDKSRYEDLVNSTKNFNKILSKCVYISNKGSNAFDNVLSELGIERKLDLLAIDIDGDDYHIFKSIQKYLPRVLIIEYNPTIPPHFNIIQKEGEHFGSSAKAICYLANRKGYELVALTNTNCIFVKRNEFTKLQIAPQKLKNIFTQTHITYIISTYDGIPLVNRRPTYFSDETKIRKKNLPKYSCPQKFIPIKFITLDPFYKKIYQKLKKISKKLKNY